jgi:hypothetical protein
MKIVKLKFYVNMLLAKGMLLGRRRVAGRGGKGFWSKIKLMLYF